MGSLVGLLAYMVLIFTLIGWQDASAEPRFNPTTGQ